MRLNNPLAILLFLTVIGVSAQASLERVKVNKNISVKLPISFTPMSQQEIISRYVSARVPIAMYSDQNRQVDFGINETSNEWQEGDLQIIKSFYKANIANLFTEVEFIQEDIQQIGGRDFIVFEFVSRVTDADNTFGNNRAVTNYTYIVYTLFRDRVLLFNLTCPGRYRSDWEDQAEEIMQSIRVNL